MVMDLTFVVLDIVTAVVFFILGVVLTKWLSKWAGYNLTIFKIEKRTKKEILADIATEQIRLTVAEKALK